MNRDPVEPRRVDDASPIWTKLLRWSSRTELLRLRCLGVGCTRLRDMRRIRLFTLQRIEIERPHSMCPPCLPLSFLRSCSPEPMSHETDSRHGGHPLRPERLLFHTASHDDSHESPSEDLKTAQKRSFLTSDLSRVQRCLERSCVTEAPCKQLAGYSWPWPLK